MQKCWNRTADQRITFAEIVQSLKEIQVAKDQSHSDYKQ